MCIIKIEKTNEETKTKRMNFPARLVHIVSFLIGSSTFQREKDWLELPLGLSGFMLQSCLWRHQLALQACAVGKGSGISSAVV